MLQLLTLPVVQIKSGVGGVLNYGQIHGDGVEQLILYSVILNGKEFEKCSAPSDKYHMVESVQKRF